MKTIVVSGDKWFKIASFNDVKMIGIKHLDIPPDRMEGDKQTEHFKRSLVRQVFERKFEYGKEFEILEKVNPFGKPAKRRSSKNNTLSGEYRFVKNGLRAPEGDIRHEMMTVISENKAFENVIDYFDQKYGKGHLFPSTGKLTYTVQAQLSWSLTRGWIIKV